MIVFRGELEKAVQNKSAILTGFSTNTQKVGVREAKPTSS